MESQSGDGRVVLYLAAAESPPADGCLPAADVRRVETVEAALQELERSPVGCVLLDGRIDPDVADVLGDLDACRLDVPTLVVFEDASAASIQAALEAGAADFESWDSPAAVTARVRALLEGAGPERDTLSTGATDADALTDGASAVEPTDRRDAMMLDSALSDLFVDVEDILYFKDEESNFLRVSESMAALHDLSREQLRGMSDFDVLPASKAQRRYEDEQRIMDTGGTTEDPNEKHELPSGDVEWYHSRKAPMRDREGDIVGTLGISREITDLKELEQTLSELEAIIDRVPVSALAVDGDGRVTWANRVADELLAPEGSLVDTSLSTITAEGALEASFLETYRAAFARLLDGEHGDDVVVIEDVRIATGEGAERICDVRVRLLPLADDSFRGTVIAFHDVTEQVRQEAALARQYERLERLVETISHDLRSPLSVAIGAVDLAAETGEDEQLDRAAKAMDRIDTLIEDLLTMATLGRAVEDPPSVSIGDAAREAWDPFEDRPGALTVDADGMVAADPDRLRRLFENLYRNALEHGPEGVAITVGQTETGFFVADDGPGIADEDRARAFEHGFTTSEDGTGLGLSIVQEIAGAHGWEVTVGESTAGGARIDVRTTR